MVLLAFNCECTVIVTFLSKTTHLRCIEFMITFFLHLSNDCIWFSCQKMNDVWSRKKRNRMKGRNLEDTLRSVKHFFLDLPLGWILNDRNT